MWRHVVLFMLFKYCDSVIYRLNVWQPYVGCSVAVCGLERVEACRGNTACEMQEEDHSRMPPVYRIDDYESCAQETGLYCLTKFDLVSDQPSELLDMIREYSEHYSKHFNYSQLHHGVCVSHCDNYDPSNLEASIEGCLNRTFWDSYQLRTRIVDFSCLNKSLEVTTADIYVGILCIVLVMLNIFASVWDYVGNDFEKLGCVKYFSMQRNWQKLVTQVDDGLDYRISRLKFLNGIRALTAILVVLAHSLLPVMLFIKNTHYVESMYDDVEKHILFNSTPTIQIFFIMSGFLLVYNFLLYAESHKVTWKSAPRMLLKRWLRFLPLYGFLLALTCTWVRYIGDGPLWNFLVIDESNDCTKNWWKHLLFFNNYVDDSQCYLQTWSLACDMQLFVIGVFICVSSKLWLSSCTRNMILGALIISGIIIPGIIIYIYDLDSHILITPAVTGKFFIHDANYNYVYRRGHTNMCNFFLGMTLGYTIYDMQIKKINIDKYKKFKPLYWSLVPACLVILLVGGIFYLDGPRLPLPVRVMYGIMSKTLFGVMVVIIIGGMILEYEDVYRKLMEFPFWTPLARISYSCYMVHPIFIRAYLGSSKKQNSFSYPWIIQNIIITICASLILSVLLWVLVEAPLNQVLNRLLYSSDGEKARNEKTANGYTKAKTKDMNAKKKTL